MRLQGGIEGSEPGRTSPSTADSTGLLVKPDIACRQLDSETHKPGVPVPGRPTEEGGGTAMVDVPPSTGKADQTEPVPAVRRFFGTVTLDPTRVGRDAGRIAEEVISHLVGHVGADVTVRLEIAADLPNGAFKPCVRISRTGLTKGIRSATLRNLRGFSSRMPRARR
jgi:hypothetical protein